MFGWNTAELMEPLPISPNPRPQKGVRKIVLRGESGVMIYGSMALKTGSEVY